MGPLTGPLWPYPIRRFLAAAHRNLSKSIRHLAKSTSEVQNSAQVQHPMLHRDAVARNRTQPPTSL